MKYFHLGWYNLNPNISGFFNCPKMFWIKSVQGIKVIFPISVLPYGSCSLCPQSLLLAKLPEGLHRQNAMEISL